jgi:Raf kinase inhibitor-like YbhB/YbcL family protein
MIIESPAFENGQKIPKLYTCDDKNVNPPLVFTEVPKEAVSLVLIVDDPDAPMGTWVHWTVWNISPDLGGVHEQDQFQGAIEGMTDFGRTGYGGPCPPGGEHRYHFRLSALDTTLDLEPNTRVEDLRQAMEGHVIDRAEIVGTYRRK